MKYFLYCIKIRIIFKIFCSNIKETQDKQAFLGEAIKRDRSCLNLYS